MNDPYYCKLYVDTEKSISDIQKFIESIVDNLFIGYSVEYPVFKNENFSVKNKYKEPYDFIDQSEFYVEFGMIDNNDDKVDDFQINIARLIGILRESNLVVTASCDFEDLIIKETGWNWTEQNPKQPQPK